MASMTIRDEETGRLIHDPAGPKVPGGKDGFGAHGTFAAMTVNTKIVKSLILDDEKLVKKHRKDLWRS